MKFMRRIATLAVALSVMVMPVSSQEPSEVAQSWALKLTASNWWWGQVTYGVTSEADISYAINLSRRAEICVGSSSGFQVGRIESMLAEVVANDIDSTSLSNQCDDEISIQLLVDLGGEPEDLLRFSYSEPEFCRAGELPAPIYQLAELVIELGESESLHCGQPSLQSRN